MRVAATPETVKKLTTGGRHQVIVEDGAGINAAIPNDAFAAAGATLAPAADIYGKADIVLKVLRPEGARVVFAAAKQHSDRSARPA
jgi:NAD(P) transhydrogenase subunit alpha